MFKSISLSSLRSSVNRLKRYEMLRHTLFYQFPKMSFNEEMTPHQIHWGIQEALEDQGVADITTFDPEIITHWSKVPKFENGNEKNISDYCAFEGGLKGSKGEPVPVWLKVAIILVPMLGFMMSANIGSDSYYDSDASRNATIVMMLTVLATLGLSYFAWYWKTYKRGQVALLYRGIYQLPQDKNTTGWQFSVDIMLSVDVKKQIGLPTVKPAYELITQNLESLLRAESVIKEQPEKISMKPQDFETRFPVQYTKVSDTTGE